MKPDNNIANRLILLPFDRDPIAALAETLLQDHRETLPLLQQITVLLPDIDQAPHLRQLLLQQAETLGHAALLGPRIVSWRSWLAEYQVTNQVTISDYRRELILVQALRKHSSLLGNANHWALADSLLQLFDELTLNKVGLPETIEDFQQRVARGYGLTANALNAMEREAQLVHILWRAWHQELNDRSLVDRNAHYLLQLAASLKQSHSEPLYIFAPAITCIAEREWLAGISRQDEVKLLLHGHLNPVSSPGSLLHPETPLRQIISMMEVDNITCTGTDHYSQLLDEVFSPLSEQPLRQRAMEYATRIPASPLPERLSVLAAHNDEDEARAVELQVRRWLLAGKKRIGVVSQNRRLARRVRALLERANVGMDDTAGWAISTTSAAAVLERWLQCIEEDFPHQAMLDLLKSPFFSEAKQRETHLADVYLLERDIVLHENIGSGIARYQRHLKYRQHRLTPELAARLNPVDTLLKRLQQAAQPMQDFIHGKQRHNAVHLLVALQQSLQVLGLVQQLSHDEAGVRLLEELQKMTQAAASETHAVDWLEFRNWLGRALERYDFKPVQSGQAVVLMDLNKSTPGHFDALVIASAEREQIPGPTSCTPFFNDAVRRELGLPTADEQLAGTFYHFRRLLEAAPKILVTHCVTRNGEELALSPWLELLLAFQQLAYQKPLDDLQLRDLLNHTQTSVVQPRSLPGQSEMPYPAIASTLLPKRYSASAYQQLMDCPYQFYAARALGLAPPEAIREALEKSDYGERVHRCLQAFHSDLEKLPGPFSGKWDASRRAEAITLLEQISDAVFARDLEDNFLHRGWLLRWKKHIPEYIDWQLARTGSWQVMKVEQKLQQDQVIPGLTLQGRLDRCDSNGDSLAIIDYKTGRHADQESVSRGEAVQLPFYALLAHGGQPVERVEYLALDAEKINSRTPVEGEELQNLSRQIGERLGEINRQMAAGTPLPAWGIEETCNYCHFPGICRRAAWVENEKSGRC